MVTAGSRQENTGQGGGLKGSGLKPVLSSIVTKDLSTVTRRLRNESNSNTRVHQGLTRIL